MLLWLLLLAGLALGVRARWPQQPEWSRKLLHIGAGLVVPLAWALGINRWIAIGAAALVTVLAAINHRRRLLPGIEDVGRSSVGTIAYGGSIALLLLLFWPEQAAAVTAGVLVMAFGDGLAGLVGSSVVSPSWRVLGQRRSLAGTLTMAITSLGVLLGLALVNAAIGLPAPSLAALVGLALGAVLLEQIALLGLDNFTVPIGTSLLWHLLSHS
ncbi:MAG: dolichol kinase [Cyanobium sp.]